MKNNKGITLVALIVTITVMILIASITISISIKSYNKSKYEAEISQIEEIQRKTDAICEKYKLYLKDSSNVGLANYVDFFIKIYGSAPTLLSNLTDDTDVKYVVGNYLNNDLLYHNGYVFLFNQEDIIKYLDLRGIEMSVIIDFSTRKIYCVEGIVNPNDKSIIYYTPSEWNSGYVVEKNDEGISSLIIENAVPTMEITVTEKTVGATILNSVNLEIVDRPNRGVNYPINKVYYSSNKTNWFKIENVQINGDSISFNMYEIGSFYFKVEDTSGATKESTEPIQLSKTKGLTVGTDIDYNIPTLIPFGYIISRDLSGIGEEQTIRYENLNWKVFKINESTNKISIIATEPLSQALQLKGALGYNNGVSILDDICYDLYSSNDRSLGIIARSIKVEDILYYLIEDEKISAENISLLVPETYSGSRLCIPANLDKEKYVKVDDVECINGIDISERLEYIGDSTSTTDGFKYLDGSNITITPRFYNISNENNFTIDSINNIIFGTRKKYWLSSRFHLCDSQKADLGLQIVNKSEIENNHLCQGASRNYN